MPNSAWCLTAQNARRRVMPKRAPARLRHTQPRSLAGAPFGITRRSGFRAFWHYAPFGISRTSAFGAVDLLAPSAAVQLVTSHYALC
jgi:hypothetical protein